VNGVTTLTFTIDNSASTVDATAIDFTGACRMQARHALEALSLRWPDLEPFPTPAEQLLQERAAL